MANATKPAWTGRQVCFEYLSYGFSKAEISVAHNGRRNLSQIVWIRRCSSGDAVKEYGLAGGLHHLRTIFPIHGSVFDTNGGNDIVPALGILKKLFKEITVVGSLAQVMVRIANR